MIGYNDKAREYIKRQRNARQYLVQSYAQREANKRKLNLINIGLLLTLIALLTVFALYLPHVLDQTWEQQYVEPMKYLEDIQK